MRIATGLDVVTLPRDVSTALHALAADASGATPANEAVTLVAALRAGITALRAQLDTDPHAVDRALVDGGAELDVTDLVFAASRYRSSIVDQQRTRRLRREDT